MSYIKTICLPVVSRKIYCLLIRWNFPISFLSASKKPFGSMQNVNYTQHETMLACLIYNCPVGAIQCNSIWYPRRQIPIPAPLMTSNITTKHLKRVQSTFWTLLLSVGNAPCLSRNREAAVGEEKSWGKKCTISNPSTHVLLLEVLNQRATVSDRLSGPLRLTTLK